MKKVINFDGAKEGDWYIFLPTSKRDKRKNLIEIRGNEGKIFSFNGEKLLSISIKWSNKQLNSLRGFFSSFFILFKLNKKEIKQYKKLILVNSL